jgi:predicted nucleic acid-binding protein
MNVYIESNFVLEHALEQEECESCADIIQLASRGRLRLVIPAFSLAEPHHAIFGKAKVRSRLGDDLRIHLNELGRSRPHREIPATFDALAASLIASAQFEREGVRRAVSQLIQVSEVIPLDAVVLRSAADMEITYGMSGQDAIVLASVLHHLHNTKPAESCFLNRDSRDFDDPDIRDRLDGLHCKFFAKFAPALAYIFTRFALESPE